MLNPFPAAILKKGLRQAKCILEVYAQSNLSCTPTETKYTVKCIYVQQNQQASKDALDDLNLRISPGDTFSIYSA